MARIEDGLTAYLKRIDKFTLLTPEEEILLATKIQAMIRISGYPSEVDYQALDLSQFTGEEQNIIKAGLAAYKRFTESNLRLVVAIAKKARNRGLEYFPLIQWGNIGLMRGIEKFDPTKGYRFSTYAYWWIKQHIQRALTNYSRTIRLPINISDNLDKIKREKEKFFTKHRREPSFIELAEICKLSEKELLHTLNSDRNFISLNLFLKDENHTLEDILTTEEPTEAELEEDSRIKFVHETLNKLEEFDRKILMLSMGIGYHREHSEKEIGEIFGMSKGEVSRALEVAMESFREVYKLSRSIIPITT